MSAVRRLPAVLVLLLGLLFLAVGGPASAAIQAEKVVSPGGIEAWLMRDASIPVVSLSIGFKGGAALDPEGKAGLSYLVSGLLDEGAGELDSLAFQTALESKAIDFSADAERDAFSVSLRTLSENREQAFTLLRLALTAPRFDAEPVERVRAQILTALAMDSDDADTVAARLWNRVAFGDHPYGRPVQGTPDSIKALTADDLRAWVGSHLTRDRMKIGVAGDISPQELGRLLDATLGDLPATSSLPTVPAAAFTPGKTVVAERDIPQSVVAFGAPGLAREDPDFYGAFVVNHILGGGGFSSRLMTEVREKRGLAYSVYSYLYPLDHAAVVMGGVATNNAKVGESLGLIRQEIRRMAENGPTQAELDAAKTYLIGSWPLRFTSTGAVADILQSMQMDDYPIDHLTTRNAKVAAVTLADAKRAARRLYDAGALSVVVVGKPQGVNADTPVPDGVLARP